MDRRACADVPALALQLLEASHPEWKALPVAVVDRDEPTGVLLWVNERGWRVKLRPGMRYASALALDAHLRAGTVADTAIAAAISDITAALRLHTPHVEPSREEAGVFWLDASGLESLYASTEAWASAVARAIRARGFEAHLAVGFTRFGTYALAKSFAGRTALPARSIPQRAAPDRRTSSRSAAAPRARHAARRVLVCESEEEERRLAGEVALERLGIDPALRDHLARLGVHKVADFLRLPADGIRRRFGEEGWHLHRRARGEIWDPLVALPPEEPLVRSLLLDDPVCDAGVILFAVRRLLRQLLERLATREMGVRLVRVSLHRSLRRDCEPLVLCVSAAEPTLDEAVLADLLRLRLEAEVRRALAGASVVEIEVEAEAAAAAREQLRLFHERTRRDLAAAGRALARLRAELGDGSVVRAVLRQGHLPEASYAWEPIDKPVAPSPRLVLARPLVRRIHEHALGLPPKPFRERDDSWIAAAADDRGKAGTRAGVVERRGAHGRVDHMTGPYIVSGGWWNREVHREYHYARTEDGEILWVYYDRRRQRWFLAGKVE